jgi:hypothetical protein
MMSASAILDARQMRCSLQKYVECTYFAAIPTPANANDFCVFCKCTHNKAGKFHVKSTKEIASFVFGGVACEGKMR